MYRKKISITFVVCSIILLFAFISHAQNWMALAPYNTLWPLWSPTLSPTDALGNPVPIVTSLTPDTYLPVQPGLTWDPRQSYPWLLYNTPLGMAYYSPSSGVDLWPAPSLLDDVGNASPLNLDSISYNFGPYAYLPPTELSILDGLVPVGNLMYNTIYPTYAQAYEIILGSTLANFPIFAGLLNPAPPISSLLTPNGIVYGSNPYLPY